MGFTDEKLTELRSGQNIITVVITNWCINGVVVNRSSSACFQALYINNLA